MIEPLKCPECNLVIDMKDLDSCTCPKCELTILKTNMLWAELSKNNLEEAQASRMYYDAQLDFENVDPRKCPKCGLIVDIRGLTDYKCFDCHEKMTVGDLILVEKTKTNRQKGIVHRATYDAIQEELNALREEKTLEDMYKKS